MDIVNPAIDRYLHELANPEDPILREMEVAAAERSFPIIGPQVGQLLYTLARTIRARRIIELGSGFGYSAYWFARAVGPDGQVVLTDHSAELLGDAENYLERGGLVDRVYFRQGDGLEILESIGGEFDIIFNDIDKESYAEVPSRASRSLRPGGMLISDNMLWFGTVLDEAPSEPSTVGVQEMTQILMESPEFDTILLPLRDGVSISVYKANKI